jgi:hypothetical protein
VPCCPACSEPRDEMTNDKDAEQIVRTARDLLYTETERAKQMLLQVVALAGSPSWGDAKVELASYAHGQGEYESAAAYARGVVAAPRDLASPAARTIAGVMLSDSLEVLDEQVDDELLRASSESCAEENQHYFAGVGFAMLGRRSATAGDRVAARTRLERAVELFDQAGSMLAGPGTLKRLAQLAIDEARTADARDYLDRGIRWLEGFPLGGYGARYLEAQLREMRERL